MTGFDGGIEKKTKQIVINKIAIIKKFLDRENNLFFRFRPSIYQ